MLPRVFNSWRMSSERAGERQRWPHRKAPSALCAPGIRGAPYLVTILGFSELGEPLAWSPFWGFMTVRCSCLLCKSLIHSVEFFRSRNHLWCTPCPDSWPSADVHDCLNDDSDKDTYTGGFTPCRTLCWVCHLLTTAPEGGGTAIFQVLWWIRETEPEK